MRSKIGTSAKTAAFAPVKEAPAPEAWEVRPCGMLVQKRNLDAGEFPVARIPTIRVKVKHGAVSHEIYISSQATFGELKKLLSARTGLHPLDQKLIYKDKERDSAAFLDTVGVKDKSKLVLVEDSVAQAKRLLEQRKMEKMEQASKLISAISVEVDKLASKVTTLETIVNKGDRVVEKDVVNLIELLMNELIKLDGLVGDGDVKLQRRMQVKRVQKFVETLDVIKVKNETNAKSKTNDQINKQPPQYNRQHYQTQGQQYQQTQIKNQQQTQSHLQNSQQASTHMTDWDIFDSLFKSPTTNEAAIQTPTMTVRSITVASTPTTRFDWELF